MKTLSLSAESLWGLNEFLRVDMSTDLHGLFPDLGVKAVMRLEHIRDSVNTMFEASKYYSALKTIETKTQEYRAEILKPYEGKDIPHEEDIALGQQIQREFTRLRAEHLAQEVRDEMTGLVLADEKSEMLTTAFEKLGNKYIIRKDLVIRIAQELGISE